MNIEITNKGKSPAIAIKLKMTIGFITQKLFYILI